MYSIVLCTFFVAACKSTPEDVPADQEQEQEAVVVDDAPEIESEELEVLTIEGMLDGSEQWFYTYKEGIDGYEDVPECRELHIIPHWDSDEIFDGMIGLGERHFELNQPYDNLTTTVKVFYTRDKKLEMASYSLVDGKPNGICIINDPDGIPFIAREYELGELKESLKSPYGIDWTFDQDNGKLSIIDIESAVERLPVGDLVVRLMQSKHAHLSENNSLYTIMQKHSFKQSISVNGELLTGTLFAYFQPKGLEPDIYYELNFTDGVLDGDVKVYNDWGELELHEVFNQGALDTTVYKINYDEMDGLAKPIIYLYPEKEQVVEVKLKLDGQLTHTYPKYEEGWKVTASPDGTIYDTNGEEYYALYWEGQNNTEFTLKEGTVVKGEESMEFLENALETLGLTRREANEFIVYWLPQLERNPYNLIHFSTEEYEEMAQLDISPEPETLIRVMMVFQPLNKPVFIPEQNLEGLGKEREGFTVVEWGGSKVESPVVF